jgi:hypothetical protein
MEEDRRSRATGKTAEAAATPTVSELKTQCSASQQPKEQLKTTAAKRKRDGELAEPPSKKPREGVAKRGDEPTSTGSFPLKDNSGEYQEEEGELGTDPVPPLTAISHESAESDGPDEPIQMDHSSEDMALGDASVMVNWPFENPEKELHMSDLASDDIDLDHESYQEAPDDDDHISGISGLLGSKEGDLLSALLSIKGYMHVVALDSDGLIRPEPRCFAGGVQCNWRSTKDAIPPRNKNWFARVSMPHTITNTPVCVVGELAEKADLQILRWTRKVANDDIDRADGQEYQRRLADESDDPVGLSLMAESLDRDPGSTSSAADNRSQGSVYEDRDFCEGSGQIRERNREKEGTWSYDD